MRFCLDLGNLCKKQHSPILAIVGTANTSGRHVHCASVRFAVRFHSHYQPSSVIARLFTLGLTPRPTNEQNKQHRYFVANVLGSLLRPRACNLPKRGDCAAAWAGAGGRSSSNAISNTLATRGTEIVTFRCSFRVPILRPKTCATKCNEELALGAQFSEPEPGLGLIFCMLLLPLWRTSPGKTIPESFPMATAGTAVSSKLPDKNFLPRAAD